MVYYPYEDASKVLLYKKEIPKLSLLKIEGSNNIRHQDIMGTIFKEGIKEDTFGDIVKYNGDFYVFILPQTQQRSLRFLPEPRLSGLLLRSLHRSWST